MQLLFLRPQDVYKRASAQVEVVYHAQNMAASKFLRYGIYTTLSFLNLSANNPLQKYTKPRLEHMIGQSI